MNELRRRRKRAQSLVIVALSATALFGIIALGLDAGRLYFQRRDVQYAVFGFQAGPGGGNTVEFDQNGYAQIDNGNNGSDICNPNGQGRVVSNSKWHAPNPHPGWLNINGVFEHLSASDTHAVRTYWYQTVNPVPVQEPAPNYEATVNPLPGSVSGSSPTFHIHAGTFLNTLSIPGSIPGGKATDTYIFDNGLYVFANGASFNITGGIVSNTSTGKPLGALGAYSDLTPAADGTDGVEFIFDQGGGFSASTSGNTSPSVFFVAPNRVPSGVTHHIAFFVRETDTNASPWSETIDGSKVTYGNYPFQVWGTVFVDEANATATIQAVSTNPYAVEGELIAPRVSLMGGNIANEPTIIASVPNGTPGTPGCTGGYHDNLAGRLVQYNQAYAPQFRGYAYLVK